MESFFSGPIWSSVYLLNRFSRFGEFFLWFYLKYFLFFGMELLSFYAEISQTWSFHGVPTDLVRSAHTLLVFFSFVIDFN